MESTLPITAATARRFLALRHFLAPPRSSPPGREGILTVFERFGSIQFDPLEVAGAGVSSGAFRNSNSFRVTASV
jgi:uncharacterized protein YcaQ